MDVTEPEAKKTPSIGRAALEAALPLILSFVFAGLIGAIGFMASYTLAVFIASARAKTDADTWRAHRISLIIASVLALLIIVGVQSAP